VFRRSLVVLFTFKFFFLHDFIISYILAFRLLYIVYDVYSK